jgi:hypothetical protein
MINWKAIVMASGATCLLTYAFLFVSAVAVSAQTSGEGLAGIGAQSDKTARPSISGTQPADSNSLTISPQQLEASPKGSTDEIPDVHRYMPSESDDRESRNFVARGNDQGDAATLGITVVYAQRAYDEVVSDYCLEFSQSHSVPESFGPERVLIRGLEVVTVRPGSPAALVGLRGRVAPQESSERQLVSWLFPDRSVGTGDFIVAVNGWPVSSPQDLDRRVSETAPGGSVLLNLVRPGKDDDGPTETSLAVNPLE